MVGTFTMSSFHRTLFFFPTAEIVVLYFTTSSSIEGFRAITENVPKTFPQALRDPVWGEPARLEFDTILTSTKSLVRMDTAIARHHIQQGEEED